VKLQEVVGAADQRPPLLGRFGPFLAVTENRAFNPFALLSLQRDKEVLEATEKLYEELKAAGVEVFWDDRDERPGVKLKDADLIGFPVRVVIGGKALAKGDVEVSTRREKKAEGVAPEKVIEVVKATLAAGAKTLAL